MNRHDAALLHPTLEQVYLIDRDSGLLCRILGLYAARGIDVQHAEYTYAAQDVMTLEVSAAANDAADAETLRVLVEKAASWVGVIAAAQRPRGTQPARPRRPRLIPAT